MRKMRDDFERGSGYSEMPGKQFKLRYKVRQIGPCLPSNHRQQAIYRKMTVSAQLDHSRIYYLCLERLTGTSISYRQAVVSIQTTAPIFHLGGAATGRISMVAIAYLLASMGVSF